MTEKTLTERETLLAERAIAMFVADREARIAKERAKRRPDSLAIDSDESLLREARELLSKLAAK